MNYSRVILFENAIETLTFFSHQIADALEQHGLETLFVDMNDLSQAPARIRAFASGGTCAVLTFNYIGFSGEESFQLSSGESLWDALALPCYNILVDHPLYYYKQLQLYSPRMTLFCVDRTHVRFLQKYYPHIVKLHFLPLAGTRLPNRTDFIPFSERTHDIVFTANYVTMDTIQSRFDAAPPEYRAFYRETLDCFLTNPDRTLEDVFASEILRVEPGASVAETLGAMRGMLFLDLVIRSHYRREIISRLADAGLSVYIVGKDWEALDCKHPENITCVGQKDTVACLTEIGKAKLSLNILPWFKDGAHDRIFSSMLQKTACVSDSSPYLQEILEPKRDFLPFSLKDLDALPQLLYNTLQNETLWASIATFSYEKASTQHTWAARTQQLLNVIHSEEDTW